MLRFEFAADNRAAVCGSRISPAKPGTGRMLRGGWRYGEARAWFIDFQAMREKPDQLTRTGSVRSTPRSLPRTYTRSRRAFPKSFVFTHVERVFFENLNSKRSARRYETDRRAACVTAAAARLRRFPDER